MSLSLDSLTLDQLRLFVAVADAGSFSAAARELHRAQSAVSYGVAKLEKLLQVELFDRRGRKPVLTAVGQSLIADAHEVLESLSKLHSRAAAVSGDLELVLPIAVDIICPGDLLVKISVEFNKEFPTVALQIRTDVLEGVAALIGNGSCHIGISGTVKTDNKNLKRRFLTKIAMMPVARAGFPLTSIRGGISKTQARPHVQIVLSQSTENRLGNDQEILSETPWRVVDSAIKLKLIREGLGWGHLPVDLIVDDLQSGALVPLNFEEWGPDPRIIELSSLTHRARPLGPAGQWLLQRLQVICKGCPKIDSALNSLE